MEGIATAISICVAGVLSLLLAANQALSNRLNPHLILSVAAPIGLIKIFQFCLPFPKVLNFYFSLFVF